MEIALADRRDSVLRTLLIDSTQRARFDQQVGDERRFLVSVGVAELADMLVREYYFSADALPSDTELAAATRAVERSLLAEAALATRAPVDSAALRALRDGRRADVRSVITSDVKRAAFDRRLSMLTRVEQYESTLECTRR